ncbi:MAG: hypothetical protein LBC43_04755 [Bifidobacteriaceae bacterium]|jgi:serine/threonine protein kinase|nr:hypothetical protein [Bifidobacteriaceae bacterium]
MDTKIIQAILEKEHLEVLEVLKQSPTSSVLLAKQRDTKVVLKVFEDDQIAAQLFKSELNALQKIDRPYYAGRFEQYRYLIVSYLGSTLESYIQNAPERLSHAVGSKHRGVFYNLLQKLFASSRLTSSASKNAVLVGRNLIKAVVNLHNSGVLHQDLKPSNIVVDSKFEVQLIDFEDSILFDHKRPASARPDIEQLIIILKKLVPEKFDSLSQPPRTLKKVEELFHAGQSSLVMKIGIPLVVLILGLLAFLVFEPLESEGDLDSTNSENVEAESVTDETNNRAASYDTTTSSLDVSHSADQEQVALDFPESTEVTTNDASLTRDLSATAIEDNSISVSPSSTGAIPDETLTRAQTSSSLAPQAESTSSNKVDKDTSSKSDTSTSSKETSKSRSAEIVPSASPKPSPASTSSKKPKPPVKPKPKPSLEDQEILIID